VNEKRQDFCPSLWGRRTKLFPLLSLSSSSNHLRASKKPSFTLNQEIPNHQEKRREVPLIGEKRKFLPFRRIRTFSSTIWYKRKGPLGESNSFLNPPPPQKDEWDRPFQSFYSPNSKAPLLLLLRQHRVWDPLPNNQPPVHVDEHPSLMDFPSLRKIAPRDPPPPSRIPPPCQS